MTGGHVDSIITGEGNYGGGSRVEVVGELFIGGVCGELRHKVM